MSRSNSLLETRTVAGLLCRGLLITAAAVTTALTGAVRADGGTALDVFTATTVAMKPAGVALRFEVRSWSDDAARADVAAALAPDDRAKTLGGLPTLGYVWSANSPVGYAIKYAHRATTERGERITLVTAPALGVYDFVEWRADKPAAERTRDYSVIVLDFDKAGRGDGTLSIAADVSLDREHSLVSLAPGASRVLERVTREPN